METKFCPKCGSTQPFRLFTQAKSASTFTKKASDYHSYCKACNAYRISERRKNRAAEPRQAPQVQPVPHEDRPILTAIRSRLSEIRAKCKRQNAPPPAVSDRSLYERFKAQCGLCALTGQPMTSERADPMCLTLDRIDPAKGYIEVNMQMITASASAFKGAHTEPEMYRMCKLLLIHLKNRQI